MHAAAHPTYARLWDISSTHLDPINSLIHLMQASIDLVQPPRESLIHLTNRIGKPPVHLVN
ncbi:Putative mRNA endoribonuclease [Cupriavidus metallidurans CH34]|uniref:mRNA endoribonuclease n=1 Tax=Cupriavidus metallidurans (strain ATCC 43123 / DSM 2839 / NBRC 102507 / CH34) TaxID=266264 RepID=D3DXN7_CUPMC|nr:Putative mRNA endoribonuclease [Cupriavidus metallidurans CH34]